MGITISHTCDPAYRQTLQVKSSTATKSVGLQLLEPNSCLCTLMTADSEVITTSDNLLMASLCEGLYIFTSSDSEVITTSDSLVIIF